MSKRAIQWAKRIGIVFFGLIILLLGTMYIVPIIFKDRINTEVQKLLSDNIIGEVSFSDMNVSFFTRFPYLTASIESVNIRGNEVQNGQVEDLISAKEFSLGINLMDLISSKISFNRVYLEQPVVNLEVDSLGNANYMVFKSSDSESSSSPFSLEIDELVIRKGNIKYTDNSAQFYFKGSNLEYIGSGKMEDVLFSLKSKLSISSFDLRYDDVYYVKDKPIGAALETLIDTKSLTFEFQKNDLKIKNLLVNFVGRFGFVENGYDMLFDIKAKDAGLGDLLSVVPPEYQKWLDSTQFDGKVNGDVKLEGQFLSLDTIRPTLALNLHLADGRIQHNGVANPLDKLTMDFSYKMPSLDLEKSEIDLNKLNFAIGNKTSDLKLHVTGFTEPTINGNFDVDTDLALLHDAIGLTAFEMKGDFTFKGDVDGKFARGVKVTKTLRRTTQDTVVVSIPKLALSGGLKNGYFKMDNLPEALENINLTYTILGETEKYQDVKVAINDIDFIAMDNYVRGYFKLNNLSTFDVDTKLEADVDLGNIKKYLPLTDIVLDGTIQLDGTMKGSYEPKRKKFPVVDAKVNLKNGYIQFARLPELPIEDIQIETIIKSARGSINDLSIKVLPIKFKVANEPFELAASLYNLNNLDYNIKSKGVLNLGDLYKIFKVDGVDVNGKIIASVFLKGLQSDAVKGNYQNLKNGGRFVVENIKVSSELFPYPLNIKKGVFKFFKEKMQFEEFEATYGSSQINMKGYLTNVVDYLLKNDTLKGKFTFDSNFVNVDEFMMYDNTSKTVQASSNGSGVIQVPNNLNITLEANAKKVKYSTYNLEGLTGSLQINQGEIALQNTLFELIGTKVNMNGVYKPLSFKSGEFDYEIKASNFDIQRAYKEVALFREMVSMAKDAYGLVSLDYKLGGKLNKDMMPVLPSLVGGGVLRLEDIQFKGFKLLGAIAKETEAKSLENGELSDVDINSSLKNNVLTIERTKMKMAGFRPRFEGQVSLDGDLNIGFRLGLPPLGIIGIPLKITGNSENFKIKLGKYKASEVIGREVEDEDDDDYEIRSVNDPLPEIKEVQEQVNPTQNVPAA